MMKIQNLPSKARPFVIARIIKQMKRSQSLLYRMGRKKVGTFERVKERLSMRKAKKSKEEITVNDTNEEKSSDAEDKSAENDPENDTEIAADQPETETKDEKVKTDTFLQR